MTLYLEDYNNALKQGAVIKTANIESDAVTPAKLSNTANSRIVVVTLGTISATTSMCAFVAPVAGSLNQAYFVNKNAITANDTNYWTLALTDKGAAGAGTDTIVTINTKATGGTAIAAYDAYDMGTLDATHKALSAGDVVLFTATKAASAANLEESALVLEFLPS